MKHFLLAARPKTLLAGVIPPVMSYAYYLTKKSEPQLFYLALCVLGALFIQLATNFFNDVIDHEKGADEKRVGPVRVSSSGLVDTKRVKRWALTSLILASICGVPLIYRGGMIFAVLGIISLYLTYGYTGGRVSLAYRGLGEIFVFLFFGLFSVLGSYYLFSLNLDEKILSLASIYGLLSTTFICINNLRDRDTDREVGKRTLATRMSPSSYRGLILFTIWAPYLLLFFFKDFSLIPGVFLASLPGVKLSFIALKKNGRDLNDGLKFSAIHLVIYSLTLGISFLYESLL